MAKITENPKTLFLIDGSSFLYRAFYSVPPMHTKDGQPVQVVYGFCRMLKKLMNQFKPAYLGVVWDPSREVPTVRHTMYEHYKEQRQSSPSELNAQRDLVKECMTTLGVRQIEQVGVEADDVLYSLAQKFSKDGFTVILVTSDKDMRQCVNDQILIFDPFKDEVFDAASIELRYSVPISKLVFYFALVGDASDNIPGARGIGPKTAQELVNKFESVDDMYARLDEISKPRTRELLVASRDNVLLSKKLFELYFYEFTCAPEEFAFSLDNWLRGREFFKRLDFLSFLKDFPRESAQTSFLEGTVEAPESRSKNIDARFITINRREDLENLCRDIRAHGVVAIDTETSALNPFEANLVGISLCVKKGEAYYMPVGHKNALEQLELAVVVELLKPVFEDANVKKYLHHAKFDKLVLSQVGLEINGLVFDTLIAAHLVTRDWQRTNLKWLSEFYLDETMLTFDVVVTKQKLKNFSEVPIELATEYSGSDAHQTFALVEILENELEKHQQVELFNALELPLVEVLYKMEKHGVSIDPAVLDTLDKQVMEAIQLVELKIQALLPEGYASGLNLNSPRQLEELLFTTLKLQPIKKTSAKTGYSTDQEVLNELAKVHPIPALIVKYRELYKIKSTYIDALKACINAKTKRIHTSFSQISTATGRLSSSDPNLQNIPTGMSGEFPVRAAFKASEDHVLLSADYSQIELRVLAYLSQDTNLLNAFVQGKDIHTQTAAELFGVSIEDVQSNQRALAKKINFSILYGLSAYGLSKDLDIPFKDAKHYIEKYFEAYPGVVAWMDTVVEGAKRDGYVQTFWGRRRYLPGIYEANRNLYELARRMAINTVVQGTAAELMKRGMLDLDRALVEQKLSSKLAIQIHDELILSVPESERILVEALVLDVLQRVASWNVPLIITTRIGRDWQEITK